MLMLLASQNLQECVAYKQSKYVRKGKEKKLNVLNQMLIVYIAETVISCKESSTDCSLCCSEQHILNSTNHLMHMAIQITLENLVF